MPELIVGRTLLRIGQHLIGLLTLFKSGLGALVVLISIGMALHRQSTIGLLDLGIVSATRYPKHFVIISFRCHTPVLKNRDLKRKKAQASTTACALPCFSSRLLIATIFVDLFKLGIHDIVGTGFAARSPRLGLAAGRLGLGLGVDLLGELVGNLA